MLYDSIQIEGVNYRKEDISRWIAENKEELSPALSGVFSFLEEWFSDAPTVQVQTSGSTGAPKQWEVPKEKMIRSARLTCDFLGLKPGDTALLCMSLQYIGAKMMVVRAITAGLNLIVREASGHPMANVTDPVCFAAMVPLQVYNSLQIPVERERLRRISQLIIGGSGIGQSLEKELSSFPHAVWSTYGMTETLSHIALRRISGKQHQKGYIPFPGVTVSLSAEQTLVIDAPGLTGGPLYTNDTAVIYPDGSFSVSGRKDNIINTGGKKIQAETIERKLASTLTKPFVVTSVPDPKFSEIIVLLIAGKNTGETSIMDAVNPLLLPWERPKK